MVYEKELRVAASPATIFELLTDPEGLTSWMGFGAELDPRPGGVFQVDFGVAGVKGEFVEVVPEKRVVFTWGWEGGRVPLGPGESTVEFMLTPDGDETIVRLRHSGLSSALREFHAWGWGNYLPRLIAVAEGRTPDPDPMADGPPAGLVETLLEKHGGVSPRT
jgi:uncharacterized protein YndB with AHSA1/START domain